MTVYAAKGRNTGVAMVVFPGGGFQLLAMDSEGTEICDWLIMRHHLHLVQVSSAKY